MGSNGTDAVDPAELRVLLDEQAVRNVHLRYCRGVDRHDWDLVADCFHEGGVDNHGLYDGGYEGFIEFAKGFVDAAEVSLHIVGNQLVEVEGDVAWHEANCVYYERSIASDDYPAYDRTVLFRYFDRMERREGKWGIVDRVVIVDGERQAPIHDSLLPVPDWHLGTTDRTDPSYNRSVPQVEYLAGRPNPKGA